MLRIKRGVLTVFVVLMSVLMLTSCEDTGTDSGDSFTLSEAVDGLKDGLIECATKTVLQLGEEDGYYKDELVKVLLPDEAQTVVDSIPSTVFSLMGLSNFEDNFVEAMNRAAETAAKDDETLEIFTDAITNISLDNAFELLKGNCPATRAGEEAVEDSPYAATIYLKRQVFETLKPQFEDIIDTVLDDTSLIGIGYSVNSLWSGFCTGVDTYNYLLSGTVDPPDDLSDYIVTKALNGIFYYIGAFEKDMRERFSSLFDAASAIYEAFQWAQEQVGTLEDSGGDVLSALPDFSL